MRTPEELDRAHHRSAAYAQYAYVDVVFGSAGVDVVVPHPLRPSHPEHVDYELVRAEQACTVFHDGSSTRRLWGDGYIVLRTDVSNARVRLRLSVEQGSTPGSEPAVGSSSGNPPPVATPFLVQHNPDGTHAAITATSGTFSGAIAAASAAIAGAITAASATISGAISSATLTLSGLLTLNGGQIQFPASQVASAGANVLDDYEEGLISPLTSPNIIYASSALAYQKIGSWVHVTGFVVFPATANANQAEINNLPFTVENSSQALGGCVSHYGNSGVSVGLIAINNTTRATMQNPTTTAAITNATLTNATVFFDFKYRASA